MKIDVYVFHIGGEQDNAHFLGGLWSFKDLK